jgi:hypothetical protein
VSSARGAEDLVVHPTQLRNWVKALADDQQHSFPGQGQMKPAQAGIACLKREVAKPKAERDILKSRLSGILGVSRGGIYGWRARPRSQRGRSDKDLGAKVRAAAPARCG